jgi:hypothetical protein
MLTSSNLKYFQADLQKRVIDFGWRLIIQKEVRKLSRMAASHLYSNASK